MLFNKAVQFSGAPALRRRFVGPCTRLAPGSFVTSPLRCPHRSFNAVDPSQLLTSPAGLMTLLYGRTGPVDGGAAAGKDGVDGGESDRRKRGTSRGRHGRRIVLRSRGAPDAESGAEDRSAEGGGGGGGGGGAGGGAGVGWRDTMRQATRSALGSQAVLLAFLVFVLSALWELCKSQQEVVREKVKSFFFTTLEVRSSQTEYAMIMDWMSRQPPRRNSRNFSLKPVTIVDEEASRQSNSLTAEASTSSVLAPGYGAHFLSYEGTKMWVFRSLDTSKSHGNFAQQLDRENDVLTITFFSRSQNVVPDFLRAVRTSWSATMSSRVRVLTNDSYGWSLASDRVRRPLDTIYLPADTKDVVEEIRTFYSLRDTYARLGIPWRRGYLFEGPPGTGKSSLIVALAGELGIPVCILSLQGGNMSDDYLLRMTSKLPPRSLLLLEDFENAIINANDKGKVATVGGGRTGTVTLSGLLNALDGVASAEGRVLVMTSNDTSRIPLPDALLRPGRIDRRVRFEHLTEEQTREMKDAFSRVLHDTPDPILNKAAAIIDAVGPSDKNTATQSPATFQNTLLDAVYKAHAESKA